MEGGGLEGERKRLGWSLQNTPSSSPCSAKCCLQQFGPHHQPSLQSHRPSPAPQDLNHSSDFRHGCVSETAPFPPGQGFAPGSACAEKPRQWFVLTPVPAPAVPAQPAQPPRLGTASRHNFKGEIRVQGVGGCF